MISRKLFILSLLVFSVVGCGLGGKKCPDCDGGGKVTGETCDFCQGKGTVPACDKCKGSGFFDAKNEKCNYCNGNGISPEYKKAYDDRKLKEAKGKETKGKQGKASESKRKEGKG